MTKEEFKRRWGKDNDDGITNDECADCYVEWGLGYQPRIRPVDEVVNEVLKAAGVLDIVVIDARNKLKPEHIAQFLEHCDDSISIDFKHPVMPYKAINVSRKKFIEEMLCAQVTDDTEIVCQCNDAQLFITGIDAKWWNANTRRLNKLLKAAEDVLSKEPPKTYALAIATLIEGRLSQIKVIAGTKEAVLSSLNEDIKTRYIDSFLKAQIVINLAYEDGDEEDLEQWSTLDELRDIGAIKMEG